MRVTARTVLPVAAVAGLAALSVAVPTASVAAPAASAATLAATIRIHPMVISRFVSQSQPPTEAKCVAMYGVPCYDAAQIQTAYNEQPLFRAGIDGTGQTIVIVDSYGSPTIRSDLATFDAQFGLPAPPSFKIIQPAGAVPPYDPSNSDMVGWAGETTLDVEWSHTMAPGASILLVETPVSETEGTAGFPQIVEAENYVIDHDLGQVISQSFSATEETFPNAASIFALRSAYINAYQHGVTVLAASGDSGATDYSNVAGTLYYTYPVTSWPDSDPLVTGVGGTQLQLNAVGQRTAPDRVWNDTYNTTVNQFIFGDNGPNPLAGGGGKSVIFHRPSYQDGVADVVGRQRGVPDIAMSAACSGPVDVYASFGGESVGWYEYCGTSEATPMFAGIVALADQAAHHSLGLINPALYGLSAQHAPGLVDITQGNNTVSFTQNGVFYTVRGFSALRGYDLASGVGTVNAALF
ncbi:MAG: S53 family peptidase, partial [Streptosporangiaceae bacterium]|nr:S53 family peptidase [Streptosporangiaceae bacterium]